MWLNFKMWMKNYDYKWKFKLVVGLPIVVALVAFDWITKGVVVATMTQGETKSFIDGFLGFTYQINPGSAYGANAENPTLAISLATIVTILLMFLWIFITDKKWIVALAFIFAGSFANLLGRAWAPVLITDEGQAIYGGVVDFLQWQFGFLNSNSYVFNLADFWVSSGIGIMILGIIWEFVLVIMKWYKKNHPTNSDPELINGGDNLNQPVNNNQLDNEVKLEQQDEKVIKSDVITKDKLTKIKSSKTELNKDESTKTKSTKTKLNKIETPKTKKLNNKKEK